MVKFLPLIILLVVLPALSLWGADEPSKDKQGSEHWAFKPPVRPAVPKVDREKRRNAIDAFILERLAREKLSPSVEADPVTLCRRLYLDLIGLPPTPSEIDAFVADGSPEAYSKLVDQLLKSPHYGERWGRFWLDAARYADSDGYEKDMSREVWMYRDWVVQALNRDLPYDRFIIEQIAGDLLPDAKQDQVVATGFLRMSMLNEEGGIDPEQFRMDAMFDRIDAVGKAVLGLSLACCQCHDHKFDPISQEEYFRVFAFLNNDHEANRIVYTPAEQIKVAQLVRQMREIEAKIQHRLPEWREQMTAWEQGVLRKQPRWSTIPLENTGDNSQRYIPQKDGSILAQGYAPTKFSTQMKGSSSLKRISAFQLEVMNDPNLPCGGPGRSFMGTFALTEFGVEIESAGKRQKVKMVRALADYANPERDLEQNFDDKSNKKRVTGPIAFAIDGKDETAWGIDAGPGRRNVPRVAWFLPENPIDLPDGALLHFDLKQNHGGWNSDDHMNNNLGRFRLSATDGEIPTTGPLPPRVLDAMATPAAERSPAKNEVVFSHWRTTLSSCRSENDAIEALWRQWPSGSTSLVVEARDEPRITRLLKRGNFLNPSEEVAAGVPAILHKVPKDAKPDRLTFARWLVDPRSPTTARAFVNRVWQAYFGTGLVPSSDELGTQGDQPSHPELLDWLACEFMEPTTANAPRWSIRHLHRLIVHSATYRQSSRISTESLARDPRNLLLARGPRFRVDGEIVRDIALTASGLLDRKLGGPSIYSPAPRFLFDKPVSYGPFNWPEATGTERYRRAIYTFRRRSTPYPALSIFDAPVGDASCVKRARTNTPLQALTGLNETVFVECARALGKRAILEGGQADVSRITFAFRLCVGRKPDAGELSILQGIIDKQRTRFAKDPSAASEVATGAKNGAAPSFDKIYLPEWAAYTILARVILNLDETITKE